MASEAEHIESALRGLSMRVIDLGLYIEEHFKNAISLLFNRDWASGYFPITPDISPIALNSQLMQLLQQWHLEGEQLRTVLMLQKACTDFESLIAIINHIAERTRSLDRDVERYFVDLPHGDRDAFYGLINSAHIQLRGCIVALSTHNAEMARRVIQQDGVLDMAYLQVTNGLQRLIDLDVTRALPVALLNLVVGDIEQLGNHITRICQGIEAIANGSFSDYGQSDGGDWSLAV